MSCGCIHSVGRGIINDVEVNKALEKMAKQQTRLTNINGSVAPRSEVPEGSYFVEGVWYTHPDKVPADIQALYPDFIKNWREKVGADSIDKSSDEKAIDKSSDEKSSDSKDEIEKPDTLTKKSTN